ncbi:MAG: hypothetical protein SNJ56_02775, partial [Termitinemataceae bacterium]
MQKESAVKIGAKAFLLSAGIILLLMIFSGLLTIILPAGEFQRVSVNGKTLVVHGTFTHIPKPEYPVWRWFTAPVEVLFAPGNAALITIILFIVSVGGSIAILEKAGVMEELIQILVRRFSHKKYQLIALIVFIFMAVSSFIGVYEGLVPMIIFLVPLALSLGWDSLTGLGMSLLPLAFGFASSVTNPFTVAVAQRVADLPLFSGSWLRIIFFLVVYALVSFFVIGHAKRVERNPRLSLSFAEDEKLRQKLPSGAISASSAEGSPFAMHDHIIASSIADGSLITEQAETIVQATSRKKSRGLLWFSACVGAAMVIVFITARSPGLSDLAFPVMALLFLIGGIGGGKLAGMNYSAIKDAFVGGAL